MVISKIVTWLAQDKNKQAMPPAVWKALAAYQSVLDLQTPSRKHYLIRGLFCFLLLVVNYLASDSMDIIKTLVPASLTILSILAGFIINLILITGNQGDYHEMTHHEMDQVVFSIKQMLKFQIETFLTYLLTLFLGLAVYMLPWGYIQTATQVLFLTGVAYSVLRSLILPFQLYELHEYKLNLMLKKKKKRAQRAWEEKKCSTGRTSMG
ncbi:hypothetical protein [Desulfobacter vibrioformis]|uniref:hypothetical protein n=1 Tax=Desulfobacter vibrioformis TaxID=34031 RepID=UPI0005561C8B|nr:hypothetical protein [Desulfobacter vibrioformis]